MSDAQPKKTKQIVIAIGLMAIFAFMAWAIGHEPEKPVEVAEPLPIGRHQIVSSPSGIVLRIDTYDGDTHRLVNNPETGLYEWEIVIGGRD